MKIKTVARTVVRLFAKRESFPTIFGSPELQPQRDPAAEERTAATFGLSFNVEKVAGKGEDAEPLLIERAGYAVVAVFDGMGGAGATICDGPGGRRTGAYYGAMLARGFVRDIAEREEVLLATGTAEEIASRIYDDLATKLEQSASLLEIPESKLRSTLLRRLPTTSAIGLIRGDGHELVVFWAGDSRVYRFTPAGLSQLTRDHLRDESDALENLERDAPLANCVHADRTFSIAWRQFDVAEPYIVISATDGCFGFVASPMHFERLLLDTMAAASSMDDWRARLVAAIGAIAGDDISMAALSLGWPTFDAMRDGFADRQKAVAEDVVGRIEQLDADFDATSARLAQLEEERRAAKTTAWEMYRTSYDVVATVVGSGEATRARR